MGEDMTSSPFQIDAPVVKTWGTELVQLVTRRLPKQAKGTGIEDWSLIGPAYVVKATGTLESMFMLFDAQRTSDATLLLRSLYENVLVFAWIGIDPATNLPRWIKSACKEAVKADDDWRLIGMSLLDSRNRAYAEQKLKDRNVKFAPDNLQMAEAIDDHWQRTYPGQPKITGTDRDFLTFRGLYRHVYRLGSQGVHQDPRSLGVFHTTDATGFTSVHTEGRDKWYLYPWLFGDHALTLGLAIASSVLGWPGADDVWAVREAAFGSIET